MLERTSSHPPRKLSEDKPVYAPPKGGKPAGVDGEHPATRAVANPHAAERVLSESDRNGSR